MQARIPLPQPEELSADQRAVYESILASRGALDGPFLAWLHSPDFAAPAEKLGAFCRYGVRLGRSEIELLILVVAAHFRCNGEWTIHAPIAVEAGIPEAVAESIRTNGHPRIEDARLAALHRFATALLRSNRIDQATFAQASALFDTPTLVEAVGLIGYYSLVAMTLNAFDMVADSKQPPAFG
ncbi:MAG TPA: hypothetical protein VL358_08920 [Caulobacteraceae bacterium]|jgi:4-carboxymuconolactone decarboxylase|nr:hypothetical protein [Caulobacteraceae bacterium]